MAAMGPNTPAYGTRPAEPAEHAKYSAPRIANGTKHLQKAFNACGGWGGEVGLAGPYFNCLRAEGRGATCGAEWNTPAKREFPFQCARVTIARGGMMALSASRQGWQRQPSVNTRCGKAHCAALLRSRP